MIYKEYFISSEFEDVWRTLQTSCDEPESVRNLYKTLFYTILNLPVDETRPDKPVKLIRDFEGMIHVAGAPDPIEWLVGREVIFDEMEKSTVAELTGHLL